MFLFVSFVAINVYSAQRLTLERIHWQSIPHTHTRDHPHLETLIVTSTSKWKQAPATFTPLVLDNTCSYGKLNSIALCYLCKYTTIKMQTFANVHSSKYMNKDQFLFLFVLTFRPEDIDGIDCITLCLTEQCLQYILITLPKTILKCYSRT